MKTKIILCLLLSIGSYYLSSQVPQGFNYQAIARDATGTVIANQLLPVRIAIQTSTGEVIWEEEHLLVRSNQFGLISLVVGKGTPRRPRTAEEFWAIDWNAQALYLKTTIQYPGTTWTEMGTAPIWSVPYSLVARDVEGPITKLGITGTTSDMEEALFEVRNKDGQTIFAVYNEGVRIYVDDGDPKGAKGGFAVGGFGDSKTMSQRYLFVSGDSIRAYIYDNPLVKGAKGGFAVGGFGDSKGFTNDYMLVSPDSIRMYIDDTGKGAKGGFAVGGFGDSKAVSAHFLDVATDASGKVDPAENRVLWYPLKNAFLTGKVLIQRPDSVGENSFASGYESKAVGDWSQALGYKAIARGDYSTAIGKNAVANDINSFAFGESALAANDESYAFGRGAVARGYRSFALGSAGVDNSGYATDVATAIGNYSFAFGQGSKSIGRGSFSIGIADSAIGDFSTAIGYYTKAVGEFSTAMGINNYATGTEAISIGRACNASGGNSIVMGEWSSAFESFSIAMGYNAFSRAYGSIAMGYQVSANRDFALATNFGTKANGGSSTAMGWNTNAKSYASVAIGRYNDTICISSTSWEPSDPLFIAGNGDGGTPSNAFTIYKNGNAYIQSGLGIGTTSPGQKLDIIAGNGRVQTGYSWLTNSDVHFKKNIFTLEDCVEKVMTMRGVSFDLINDSLNIGTGRKNIGFIAQELENVIPEVVVTSSDGYKSVAYDKITAVLTEAIKEQQIQIESTKQENRQLRSELAELKTLINSLIANQAVHNDK